MKIHSTDTHETLRQRSTKLAFAHTSVSDACSRGDPSMVQFETEGKVEVRHRRLPVSPVSIGAPGMGSHPFVLVADAFRYECGCRLRFHGRRLAVANEFELRDRSKCDWLS